MVGGAFLCFEGVEKVLHSLEARKVTIRQRLKTLLPLRWVLLVLTRFQTVEHLLHPFSGERVVRQ
jgi:anthranilate phosphoribosyltransferase